MESYRYVILGAGPAGLSFAQKLYDEGEENFILCEKEMQAGGLCRSVEVDGAPMDVGGGHFLDVRNAEVTKFLFQFMPEEEWNLFQRDSQIEVEHTMIGHPFEANIWQLPQEMQVAYLKSIAVAGCNIGIPQPEKFIEWIQWKLGNKIADEYMIPYNSKMFGTELNELGTYWLEKLPNVSFEETLLSCLNRKPYGTQPGHAQFYYPKKYGYGELWLRMASVIDSHIKYGVTVNIIDFNQNKIVLSDGTQIKAEYIIMTIPWTSVAEYEGAGEELLAALASLKHTALHVTYIPEHLETEAQWIYCPSPDVLHHRILVRGNFSLGSKGYWTETNSERYECNGNLSFANEYAYPLNTLAKPEIMKKLLAWSRKKQVFGLGRWGEWEHYNSDVVVKKAIGLAKELVT